MSRFLYPIRRLKVMPWIKYYLIKRTAGTLSEVMENLTSPITLTGSLRRKFHIFEIGGNSVQDGTPTPESPIPIQNVGDNINLFNKDTENILNAYADFTTSKITTSVNSKLAYLEITGGKTYTVSKILSTRFRVTTTAELPEINVTTIDNLIDDNGTVITINTSSNSKYLCIGFYNASSDTLTVQEILNSIKVEEGTKATSYSPYNCGSVDVKVSNGTNITVEGYEEQTVTLQLPEGMEMCKIGDYADKFVKQNGKWYKYKQIMKMRIMPANVLRIEGIDSTKGYIVLYNIQNKSLNNRTLYCNSLSNIGLGGSEDNSNKIGINNINTDEQMRFRYKTGELTLVGAREFLTNNEVIIQYVAKTSVSEEITDETLINELDSIAKLYTYKGTTYISSDNIPSPTFTIQYVKNENSNNVLSVNINEEALLQGEEEVNESTNND